MTSPATPLFTDLYQLTMMQGYFNQGMQDTKACFDLFFRSHPFGGGYSIFAGLEDALSFLSDLSFSEDDLRYLRSLELFDAPFLEYLRCMKFTGDVLAPPEGSVVFPREPILRLQGPLAQCQLVESALLNIINFQSLIATKAHRICRAAGDGLVLDFGLRRAQGVDGAMTVARASWIGGCGGTSNVAAGKRFGIPLSGTQAHSWVMAFDSEAEAFDAFARAYPRNSILLVDTYDTLKSGLPNAIATAKKMRQHGENLSGIRIDSGDLVALSKGARSMLDDAGFPDVKIVVSGDLDEYAIQNLKQSGAPIDGWGVGTRLATAHGDPAFTGVYKLSAIANGQNGWRPTRKKTDELYKASLPGIKQVYRASNSSGCYIGDIIETIDEPAPAGPQITGFGLQDEKIILSGVTADVLPLLSPVMAEGKRVCGPCNLNQVREKVKSDTARIDPEILRLESPAQYPVLMGPGLAGLLREFPG